MLEAVSEERIGVSGRKETVLDLAKFVDKGVQVKHTGKDKVSRSLIENAKEFESAKVENNKLCVSIRYHNVEKWLPCGPEEAITFLMASLEEHDWSNWLLSWELVKLVVVKLTN
ncbi:hypothetical protein QJS10_CPB04g01258 [Acorus calamus]|uniref:Uncharacterized protein n=1 Tax=Acorus calamus TaxID=4465 RepID=A0AAV9F5I0_ACOCL|nr:hypothetical protein QJS10_CPB04g01258 [Acorus calamus]